VDSLLIPSNEFLSDEPLLREIQRRAVRFFWQEADPATGLVKDRAGNFDQDQYTAASIASTGYGLAALPIGVTNQWLSRPEAAERARKTLRFLLSMPNEKGWMGHFVDKHDGARIWNSEFSSIDTGILLC
jgi:hypothetical protein